MNSQEFTVSVGGADYHVFTSTNGNNDSFQVVDRNTGRTVTDSFGDCNPLRSLWSSWRYQTVHGAARAAMEHKCIRESVEREIESHMEFCLDSLDESVK